MTFLELSGISVILLSVISEARAAYCNDGSYYFYCGDGCCYSRNYYYNNYITVCCDDSTYTLGIALGVTVAVIVIALVICALYCRWQASKGKRNTGGGVKPKPKITPAKPPTPVHVGTTVHGHDGGQAQFAPPPPQPPPQPMWNTGTHLPPPGQPNFAPGPGPQQQPVGPGFNPYAAAAGDAAYPPPAPTYSYGNAPY